MPIKVIVLDENDVVPEFENVSTESVETVLCLTGTCDPYLMLSMLNVKQC